VLSGAASLGAGQALGQALSFVRNIIVARLLSPADFGIAAMFAITVSLLEMISDLAADKLIIQAKDGDDPRLQSTAQLWQFIRGLASGLIIALLAWPVATLFNVPQATWAFYWLAFVPVLRGVVHLDIRRLQREMRFWPAVASETAAQVAATAAAFPLAWWLRDYAAMLWIVILQAGVLALVSHLVAQRGYRWAWDRKHAARLLEFGWPLLINGALMFAIFHGDRLIVGSMYSMEELGYFSVAVALTSAPTALLASLSVSILLPLLAQVQDDRQRLTQRYVLSVQLFAVASGLVAAVFVLLGPLLILLLFGGKYAGAADVLGALAIMQAVRLFRIPPTVAAMARGDTRNSMIANIARLGGLPLALLAAAVHAPVPWVAVAGVIGEALGFAAAIIRLKRRQAERLQPALVPVLAASGGAALTTLIVVLGHPSNVVRSLLSVAAVIAGAAFLLAMRESRTEVRRLLGALFFRHTRPALGPLS
jgi:O-antigen/teichoic acid export membrane protein